MNLMITLTAVLQLVLVVLAQIPSSIESDGTSDGIRLVMEKSSGNLVYYRQARALDDAIITSTTNGDSHRLRNNRKINKSQEHFQQVHKSGSRKLVVAENGSAATQNSQPKHKQGHKNTNKQQRQGTKQQHAHSQHHGGKRTGPKAKTSNNGSGSSTCRYAKSAWSNCDDKTNVRTRVLSLKKGEQNCLPTRTIQKKCKKGCRYDKGTWSQCNDGHMTREDKLQAEAVGDSDQNCDPVRTVSKKCKANSGAGKQHGHRGTKERKGDRRILSHN
ncbi:uncharacterized protein LOC108145838 [Drosophila elegans]|uniref:uncharacterized protein LOC108145838 n=1 Tax=Drosophila elegans TaxID=30023 RepID=UPI0007E69F17|nr:uncharacterized protein LOC108145838 [Drosophila elegans]